MKNGSERVNKLMMMMVILLDFKQKQLIFLHIYIPLTLYPRRDSRGILNIFPRRLRYLAMRITDVSGGKPIAV
jgi:hypothetical protein